MIVGVTLVLVVLVVAYLGYPLLRPTALREEPLAPALGQRERLVTEREHALATLKDLEFEYSIGHLSQQDYDALRAPQRLKAVSILRELDRLLPDPSTKGGATPEVRLSRLDALVESEVAQARQRLLQEATLEGESDRHGRCPACGTVYAPTARVCNGCGRRRDGEQMDGEAPREP